MMRTGVGIDTPEAAMYPAPQTVAVSRKENRDRCGWIQNRSRNSPLR